MVRFLFYNPMMGGSLCWCLGDAVWWLECSGCGWCERIKWLHLVWQVMAIIGIMSLCRPPQHQRWQHNSAEYNIRTPTSTFTFTNLSSKQAFKHGLSTRNWDTYPHNLQFYANIRWTIFKCPFIMSE